MDNLIKHDSKMTTRRNFLLQSGALAASTLIMPSFNLAPYKPEKNLGVQLYTFRNEMDADALGTLKNIASIGIKKIESARSGKGHYYGFKPKEMKAVSYTHLTLPTIYSV